MLKDDYSVSRTVKGMFLWTLIIGLIFVLVGYSVLGAHTFDYKKEIAESTANPIVSWYNTSVGTTLLVMEIFVTTTASRAQTAPTYNGVDLTIAGTYLGDTGGEGTAEIWYMLNPPIGNYTISVPDDQTDASVVISSYKTASGYTSAFDATATNSSGSSEFANPSVSITTSVAGDVVVDALFDGLTSAPTANNNVLLYSRDTGQEDYASQYNLSSSAQTFRMNYTLTTEQYQLVVAAFKEVLITTPVVNINVSINNTIITTATPSVSFNYTDSMSSSANCSLYLNSTSYGNNASVKNNTLTTITASTISNGNYLLWINCTSTLATIGKSSVLNVTITTASSSCVYSGSGTWNIVDDCNMTANTNLYRNVINITAGKVVRLNATWSNISLTRSIIIGGANARLIGLSNGRIAS